MHFFWLTLFKKRLKNNAKMGIWGRFGGAKKNNSPALRAVHTKGEKNRIAVLPSDIPTQGGERVTRIPKLGIAAAEPPPPGGAVNPEGILVSDTRERKAEAAFGVKLRQISDEEARKKKAESSVQEGTWVFCITFVPCRLCQVGQNTTHDLAFCNGHERELKDSPLREVCQ